MMTIDIDTISGVPLTGELNTARPKMSAQTRNPSRKMMTAAPASSEPYDSRVQVLKHFRQSTERVAEIESRRPIQ